MQNKVRFQDRASPNVGGLRKKMLQKDIFYCHFTDASNAQALSLLFGNKLRYVHGVGWHVWNGNFWQPDIDHQATEYVKRLALQRQQLAVRFGDPANKKDFLEAARRLENTGKALNCLTMAESAAPFSTLTEHVDRNPMLLTCRNGTIDLKTGKLKAADPKDLITHCTSVSYAPTAKAPRWEKFLKEVFVTKSGLGDWELIAWIQKVLGYTLTGHIKERSLYVNYGEGANGKTTVFNVIEGVMGGYAGVAAFSSFLEKPWDSAANDIAALRGRRLVGAAETGPGKYLDEVKIKQLTGGDPVTCRFLYHEPFTYVPTFKIFLACNDKPRIRGTDAAIWDRIKVIPFNARFEGKGIDKELTNKLLAEGEGILSWLVEGCLRWQKEGLDDCNTVKDTTALYRTEEDAFSRFLKEKVKSQAGAFTSVANLWVAHTFWTRTNGEKEIASSISLGKQMERKGYHSVNPNNVRGYNDIVLV